MEEDYGNVVFDKLRFRSDFFLSEVIINYSVWKMNVCTKFYVNTACSCKDTSPTDQQCHFKMRFCGSATKYKP